MITKVDRIPLPSLFPHILLLQANMVKRVHGRTVLFDITEVPSNFLFLYIGYSVTKYSISGRLPNATTFYLHKFAFDPRFVTFLR